MVKLLSSCAMMCANTAMATMPKNAEKGREWVSEFNECEGRAKEKRSKEKAKAKINQ